MAQVAALSDKGPVRGSNQDACCVEVAETPYGEVVMAIMCDGVGGLELGELASGTVVARFSKWFEEDLPGLCHNGLVDHGTVRIIWGAILSELNDLIQAHAIARGGGVGTTFSGIFAHSGKYVAAHVGDSRIYQVGPFTFDQLTEDQTLLAKELAEGNITPEEAKTFPKKNVILQSVGTERSLKPAFYEGKYSSEDIFVLCSDGAYKRPGSEGIRLLFQTAERSEAALSERCRTLVEQDIVHGEKDNVSVVCFTTAFDGSAVPVDFARLHEVTGHEAIGSSEDDIATTVFEKGRASNDPENDDVIPTSILQGQKDEDDLPTAIMDGQNDDDLPTAVMPENASSGQGGEVDA